MWKINKKRKDKFKLIRKEKIKNEEKVVIEFNLSKSVILIWAIVILISSIIAGKIIKIMKNGEEQKQEAATIASDEAGNVGHISSVSITETKTGVGPFDEKSTTDSQNSDGTVTWTAGNDTSEDDNIVRSFDQIEWTIENTLSLKDAEAKESYTGGTIEITASVPSEFAGLVEWDTDSMNWMKNAEISEDCTTITGEYSMSEEVITIPGKQTLNFILKLKNVTNGQEIIPTFTAKLKGNEDDETKTIKGETVYVSSTPKYNIQLVRNSSLAKRLTVDYGDGDTSGRMYGYGIILQLYNDDSSKGLKGLEYPTGNITFDIDLKLERTLENSSTTEDITDVCIPILWNYKINESDSYGIIEDRIMKWGNYHEFLSKAPYGIILTDRTTSVYNSGTIKMEQNKNTITTTISGYEFDGTFPKYNYLYNGAKHTTNDYSENIGCFSVGYFQIFVPDNDESTLEERSYYLTVSDDNFNAKSYTGKLITTQQKTTDDSSKIQHVIHRKGVYSQSFNIVDESRKKIGTSEGAGDAKLTIRK